jgi:hypothetical protein
MIRWVFATLLLTSPVMADCTRHTVEDEGFSSLAFVTTDPDWQAKAEADGPGSLDCVDQIKVGETGVLLVMFSGAGVVDGHFAVDCDFTVTGANGDQTIAGRQPCAHFILNGQSPKGVYLTVLQVGMRAELDEIDGTYQITYGLTDGTTGKRLVHEISIPVVTNE